MDDESLLKIEEIQGRAAGFDEQIKLVDQQLSELDGFRKNIEDIEKNSNKEILASIGKGVFMPAEITDRNLFVEVGSGVFVKKTLEETKKVAEEQLKKLGEMRMYLGSEINMVNSEIQEVISKSREH